MPLWQALARGELSFVPDIHYWKNLNDLRGILLAGKGDIWVGSVDVFAQAFQAYLVLRLQHYLTDQGTLPVVLRTRLFQPLLQGQSPAARPEHGRFQLAAHSAYQSDFNHILLLHKQNSALPRPEFPWAAPYFLS